MKKTNLLLGAIVLLLTVSVPAHANHRVVAGSWCGNKGVGDENDGFWNDLCFNDSICRTESLADTVVNLFYDGTPPRGDTNWQLIGNNPKYYISFVDGNASLLKLDSITRAWAYGPDRLDSTDILYFTFAGHGNVYNGHSYIDNDYDECLYDSVAASYFNRIHAYKIFVLQGCNAWGKGNSPDSCGFATWLGHYSPDSARTIILSASGPIPANDGRWADDEIDSTGLPIHGCEIEWSQGVSDHSEFSFHILTALNGGAEPSGYRPISMPGFYFDSIDGIDGNNKDSLISVAEAFAWDRYRNSQLGFENNQMLDIGNKADSFILWPRIQMLESLPSPYTAIKQPRQSQSPTEISCASVMSRVEYLNFLAAHQSARIAVFNELGQRVRPEQLCRGIYFWRSDLNHGQVHKVLIVD